MIQKLWNSHHHHLEKLDSSTYSFFQFQKLSLVWLWQLRWSLLLYEDRLWEFLNMQLLHQLVHADLEQRLGLLEDKQNSQDRQTTDWTRCYHLSGVRVRSFFKILQSISSTTLTLAICVWGRTACCVRGLTLCSSCLCFSTASSRFRPNHSASSSGISNCCSEIEMVNTQVSWPENVSFPAHLGSLSGLPTYLVFVVDRLSLDRVVGVKLCAFACQSKQHGPLQVHPQLGVQVFLLCLIRVGWLQSCKKTYGKCDFVTQFSQILLL